MARSTSSSAASLSGKMLVLACAMLFLGAAVRASDPDPLQDFCVTDLSPSAPLENGYPCKARKKVSAQDFVYTGFRKPVADPTKASTGATASLTSPETYPGSNTQGISHARLDFAIGGVVPLHTHPRAVETLFVVKGSIYAGFVSDDNVLYAATLQVGDVILFPRGLSHFQLNVGKETAIAFNSLNSQNPGFLFTVNQIFETNIPSVVIEKSFGINAALLKKLKASVPTFG